MVSGKAIRLYRPILRWLQLHRPYTSITHRQDDQCHWLLGRNLTMVCLIGMVLGLKAGWLPVEHHAVFPTILPSDPPQKKIRVLTPGYLMREKVVIVASTFRSGCCSTN